VRPSSTGIPHGRIDLRFPLRVGLVLLLSALALGYPLIVAASPATRSAVVLGAGLATVNVLLGYAAIEYAFHRSYTAFLKAVLGGMGIRMVLVLGVLVALITHWGVPVLPLTISLFAFYIVFLTLEVLYIQRKVSDRHQEQHAPGH
jgi:hypothetical protein